MKILIEKNTAIKLKYYTELADGEISGWGKSKKTKEGDILITDIRLFEQQASGSSTIIDDSALSKFMYDLTKAGESLEDWNVWWHTHNDFNVFWSGTDNKTIEEHAINSNHLVSIVTNKKGEFKGRLDIFPKDLSPYKKTFLNSQFDLDVEIEIDAESKEIYDKEIEDLEQEKSKLEEKIEEIDKKIDILEDGVLEDQDIFKSCCLEVDSKVRKFEDDKKDDKRKLSTKRFENALFDIFNGCPYYEKKEKGNKEIGFKYNDKHYYDTYDSYEDDDALYYNCPVCNNPIIYCECPDALDKYGEELLEYYGEDYYNYLKDEDFSFDSDKKELSKGEGFFKKEIYGK